MTRSKYKNIKTEIDGITFDSKKEAKHYCDLKILLRQGLITDLTLQPKFKYNDDNGKLAFTYIADFQFYDVIDKKWRVQDVKGVLTPIYKLKKKLIEPRHNIEIEEI